MTSKVREYTAAKFWPRVEKSEGCWLWIGRTYKGYGRYSETGAHRVSYLLSVGPIPSGMEIDHLCGEPLCVRPDHLEPVDRMENMRRRYAGQTHCKHGHEFTPENTRLRNGRRNCRACVRRYTANYKARKMESAS